MAKAVLNGTVLAESDNRQVASRRGEQVTP
jgi:hypothetical protein